MAFALVLLYVALNLLSPVDMIPALAPYRPMLVMTAVTLPLSVFPMLSTSVLQMVRTQFLLISAFVLFVGLSWVPQRWFGGVIWSMWSVMPDVAIYFLAIIHFRSIRRLQILRAVMVAVAIYVLIMGISQIPLVRATGMEAPYVMGGLMAEGGSMIRIRGLGLLHDPNTYGQYMLMILPLLFVPRKVGNALKTPRLAYPIAAIMLVGIYLTNSRGAELGVMLLVATAVMQRTRAGGVVLSAVLFPGGALIINATRDRTISVTSGVDRLRIWSDGLAYFKSSPLWGIGYNAFIGKQGMTAHNSFLLCAAELGLIGLTIWMGALVVTSLELKQLQFWPEMDPVAARWAQAIRLSLYSYLFTSFFLSRTYNMPLFLLLGMAGAVYGMAGGELKLPRLRTNWAAWSVGLSVASLALTYVLVRLRAI